MSTPRQSVAFVPSGESPTQQADKTRIIDQHLMQFYTPSSAADTSAPGVKFAYDASYIYVQVSTGVWRRVAHGTW